jgi:hypothetical protein
MVFRFVTGERDDHAWSGNAVPSDRRRLLPCGRLPVCRRRPALRRRVRRMKSSVTSLALGNLRAFVILIVLGVHSVLAYLASSPQQPGAFDRPPYEWNWFPIIDADRWLGFDIFCAWQDLYLMSLLFFVSGLFVWPSLARKQSGGFLSDRLLRLGLPLVLAVYLLMPLALYPAYLVRTVEPSLADFWRQWLSLPAWPCGPQWFLWQLLALNIAAAALYRLVPQAGESFGRMSDWGRDHPAGFLLALLTASGVAYVPLALIYTPWEWYQIGPIGFQYCRPLHYTVYYFAGVALGANGLDRGLLAADGLLPRHWPLALAGAVAGFLLWIVPTAIIQESDPQSGPAALQWAANIGYVLGCATGCIFVLAISLRYGRFRLRMVDSLSANAYGMYLVHYVFVVWLQYALLGAALWAVVKAAAVFAGTVLSSWGATLALGSLPFGSRVIRARQGPLAKAPQR